MSKHNITHGAKKVNSVRKIEIKFGQNYYIRVRVKENSKPNSFPATALIDTGSSFNLLSADKAKQLHVEKLNNTDRLRLGNLRTADGARVTAEGKCNVNIEIGDALFPVTFFVIKSLASELILGVTFLREYGAQIDCNRNVITFDNELVAAVLQRRCKYVLRVDKTCNIPARSESLVPVKIPLSCEWNEFMIQPLPSFGRFGLFMARTVVSPSTRYTFCQICNPTEYPIQLKAGRAIAEPVEIDQTLEPHSQEKIDAIVAAVQLNSDVSIDEKLRRLKAKEVNVDLDHLTAEQRVEMIDLLHEYLDVFAVSYADLEVADVPPLEVELLPGSRPVRQRPYRLSAPARKAALDQVNDMKAAGLVYENPYSRYCSPVIIVPKPGNKYRLVVDYRKVNAQIREVTWPLMSIDDVIHTLSESKSTLYTSCDLNSGFSQVALAPGISQEISSFGLHNEVLTFTRVPQGLKISPLYFMSCMDKILKAHPDITAICYVDDFLLHDADWTSHTKNIRALFDCFRKSRIKIKGSKSQWAKKSLKFLGHVFGEGQVSVDPAKIDLITNWKVPHTVKGLKRYIGLCSYYRKFIFQFSKIQAEFSDLLSKNAKFEWKEKHQKAFELLKEKMTSAPCLRFVDNKERCYLMTDASTKAIGWILHQMGPDGQLHPCIFGGRTLSKSEQKYPITELECLSLVCAVQNLHVYLAVGKFTVFTDHLSLKYLNSLKLQFGRLGRWSMVLQQYDMEIVYKPGKQMANVDALSRRTYEPHENRPYNDVLDDDANFVHAIQLQASDCTTTETVERTVDNANTALSRDCPTDVLTCDMINADDIPTEQSVSHMFTFYYGDDECNDTAVNSEQANAFTHQVDVSQNVELGLTDNTCEQDGVFSINDATDDPAVNNEDRVEIQLNAIDVKALQAECSDCRPMMDYLMHGILPTNDDIAAQKLILESIAYMMHNDTLYHLFEPRTKRLDTVEPVVKQLVIPMTLREKVLRALHDENAHIGFAKTYSLLKRRYFWKNSYTDLYNWICSCEKCTKCKGSPGAKAPMVPQPIPSQVFEKIHLDYVGPFVPDSSGAKYVLTIVDSLSMWPIFVATKSTTTEEVVSAIYDSVISIFGVPRIWQSDRGSCFISAVIKAMAKLVGAKISYTSSMKPQGNSRVENMHYQLVKSLKTMISEQSEWSKFLASVALSHRSTPTTATGFSPAYLVFGHELSLPIDLTLLNDVNTNADVDQYLRDFLPKLETARDAARHNLEDRNTKTKAYYDKFSQYPTYRTGDRVMLHEKRVVVGQSSKLTPSWVGPWIIEACHDNFLYTLRHAVSLKLHKSRIHANRLKLCVERNSPRQNKPLVLPPQQLPALPSLPSVDSNQAIAVSSTANTDLRITQRSTDSDQLASNSRPVPTTVANDLSTQQSSDNAKDSDAADADTYYEIERVTAKRFIHGKPYYRIVWKGNYPASWECEENLNQTALDAYHEMIQQRRRRSKRQ